MHSLIIVCIAIVLMGVHKLARATEIVPGALAWNNGIPDVGFIYSSPAAGTAAYCVWKHQTQPTYAYTCDSPTLSDAAHYWFWFAWTPPVGDGSATSGGNVAISCPANSDDS